MLGVLSTARNCGMLSSASPFSPPHSPGTNGGVGVGGAGTLVGVGGVLGEVPVAAFAPGEVVVLAGFVPGVPVGRLDGHVRDLPAVVAAVALSVLAPLADVPVALVEAGLLDEVLLAAGGNTAGREIVVAVELAVIIDPERRGGGSGVRRAIRS